MDHIESADYDVMTVFARLWAVLLIVVSAVWMLS